MTIEDGFSDRGGTVDIGRVIGRTFAVIARNPGLFLIFALLLGGIPSVLPNAGPVLGDWLASIRPGVTIYLLGAAAWLIFLLGSALLQAVLVKVAVSGLGGGRVTPSEALGGGLSLILPLIGLTVVTALGIGLGAMLFIVPGIMLACAWSVAVPALVEERGGVFEAMGRSRALTRGSRWYVLALFAIYWVASLMLGSMSGLMTFGSIALPIVLIVDMVTGTITSMVGAAGIAALYVELRTVREGASFDALADIFD